MGRMGPLTSQGLGRSPYDDVVPGEGEPDPREPPQQYDERGRPMNPLTRQMNKDIIRSHNEVMQVIGVAEPENLLSEPQKLKASHEAWENHIGVRLLSIGRFVNASGVWGVMGMRQRILLYQPYSHIPLLKLWAYERQHRSLGSIVFAGYPSFAAAALLIYGKFQFPIFLRIYENRVTRRLYEAFETWIQFHLDMFAVLQQLGAIPARRFLPDPMFFIPCSSTSLILAPPAPAAFTATELLKWISNLALNAAPVLGLFVCRQAFTLVRAYLRRYFVSRLPMPTSSSKATEKAVRPSPNSAARSPPPATAQSTTPPQSPAPSPESAPETQPAINAGGFPTTSQMRPREEPRPQVDSRATASDGTAHGVPPPPPPGHVRRQSTISARGVTGGFGGADSYGSDEEDNSGHMVSTTLISFDVEATDATDPPPGQWSAELRPNVVEGSRSDGTGQGRTARQPAYRDTVLTRLPALMAADNFTWLTSQILSAPVEAITCRWFARSYASMRGLSVEGMYPVWSLGVTRHMVANFLAVQLVQYFIQFDIWAALFAVASNYFVTEEEWSEIEGALEDQVD